MKALGLRSIIKDVAWLGDRIVPNTQGIVILLYHRVGVGSGSTIDCSVSEFDRQMGVLARRHRVLPLDQAADELRSGVPVQPGIVVTFDDGTADFVEHALPILDRHQVPATLYVATGLVGTSRAWPDGGVPVSRAGLVEAFGTGLVTLGSHTHTHKLLDRLPLEEVRTELDRSVDLLGEWCGADVRHFAYPKAVPPSSAAAELVAARFDTAALAESGANTSATDLHRLRRTPIQSTDAPRHLEAKFRGGLALESWTRAVANRVRYRNRVD